MRRTLALSALLAIACSSPECTEAAPCDAGAPDAGPRDAGMRDACSADACVESCDEGFVVCATGCCAVDTGDVELGNARLPSIAVDSNNRPHVAFLVNSYELRYARLDAAGWSVEPIGIDGENEYTAAIALDSADQPLVAFEANYAVKLGRYSTDGWSYESVYESAQGYGPSVHQQGLVVDASDTPHLAVGQEYFGSTTYGSRIMHFTWNGSAWQRSDLIEYFDNRISYPSIAIAGDVLQMSWVTIYDGVLRHASNATGSWVLEEASQNGNCCESSFVALASDGTPRVAFQGAGRALAVADRSTGSWSERPLVDDIGGTLRNVGSIAVDSSGELHYVYANDAGQLLYVTGGVATIVTTGMPEFMMVLDANDAAHIVYTSDTGLHYARY